MGNLTKQCRKKRQAGPEAVGVFTGGDLNGSLWVYPNRPGCGVSVTPAPVPVQQP